MTEIRTKLSILCDNFISAPDFMGQHGFSSLIEREDRKLLFDCGLRPSLEHNLETLGNNLAGLSGIMLSHGHYDHTDGLRWALEQAGRVEITAHPGMFEQHLALPRHEGGGAVREIGCPYSREELESLGAEFRFLDHTDGVAPGIRFLTSVRRKEGQSPVDPQLLRPGVSGTLEPDPIDDDASLLLDTTSGPVLLLGCAHAGLLNILDHVKEELGIPELHAILGGTHLVFLGADDLPRIIERIEEFKPDVVGVSHCTGFAAASALASHFGPRFRLAAAGSVFAF